jgi:hypothetical protein
VEAIPGKRAPLDIMKLSPVLEFESSAFPIIPGEDEETNPGVYGKALAQWLSEQLRVAGVPAGEVIPEDFGWCVSVDSKPHALYVACASTGEIPDQWRVFAFAEGGLMARILGKDNSAPSLESLFKVVRHCLESVATVRSIREDTT